MKNYLLKILLFFAIVALVDTGVGLLGDYLQAHAKSGDTKRTNDLVANDTHDVLILGSSRAYHHYDTRLLSDTLGLDVYNAGYDGNGVILATGLLEMVLERYQPKLVIYDVEPVFDINVYNADNHNIRYISRLKPYYHNPAIGSIIRAVSKEEWYKSHSGMIRYNTSIVQMLKENISECKEEYCGYAPMYGEYSGELLESNEHLEIDSLKLSYLEKLIELAHAREVPIIFVASPKYVKAVSDVLMPVKEICNRHNVVFLDYYVDSAFIRHKEWFKEPMHLNAVGARAFSQVIAKKILQLR